MAQLRVTLGIGVHNANQEDIIEVDDHEIEQCETDAERDDLFEDYWKSWMENYLDGGYELIKSTKA